MFGNDLNHRIVARVHPDRCGERVPIPSTAPVLGVLISVAGAFGVIYSRFLPKVAKCAKACGQI